MNKLLNITCRHCGETFSYYDSPARPFCSQRCKSVDLGMWFNEEFAIASEEPVGADVLDGESLNEE